MSPPVASGDTPSEQDTRSGTCRSPGSCQHISKFPRSQRFTLGERLERRLYELLESLFQVRYVRERQGLLRQANLSVEVLRYLMWLAHELQGLRTRFSENAVRSLHEIGAMVGGWLKQDSGRS